MAKSFFSGSKRIIAGVLSALMLTSVISGCEKDAAVSQDTETFQAPVSENVSETVSDVSQGASGGTFDPLNRSRIRNGLITAVEALFTDGKCITTDCDFRITASEDVSAEEIKSRISMSPATEFSIVRENSGTYLLSS